MKRYVSRCAPFAVGLLLSAPAFAALPGATAPAQDRVVTGTGQGDAALSAVQSNVPDEAAPAIQRSREESATGSRSAQESLDRGPGQGAGRAADPGGLDKAAGHVRGGTQRGQEVLDNVAGEVPDEARPAVRSSREYSRTGEQRALEGLDRGRGAGGFGRPPLGNPGRGGAGRGGRP
jgi:hypothetical protein